MRLKAVKKAAACAAVLLSVCLFGTNAFSIVDFSVGESGFINNESTPYKVSIISGDKVAAVVPIGVGIRGDANSDGKVNIQDAIQAAKYFVGTLGDDYKRTIGYAMADTNQDKRLNLYDAINIAKYMIAEGSHEEKWDKVLNKN